MKNIKHYLSFLLLIPIGSAYSQLDTANFGDKGWLKLMDEGADYYTIRETARLYYSDTNNQVRDKNYHHYVRWDNFWRNRAYSSSDEVESGKKGLFHHMYKSNSTLLRQPVCTTNHSVSDWESWGFDTHPINMNTSGLTSYGGMGVMFTVKIDTADHSLNTIYAGSPLGGLWKTTDRGDTWTNITDVLNMPSMSISHIDIDPRDNQHLLVATGAYWSFNPPGHGVIESFDGGQTWDSTGLSFSIPNNGNLGPNEHVQRAYFHPEDSNIYFAGVDDKLVMSLDQGVTWDSIILTLKNPHNNITNIKFHPTHPDTFYVSSQGREAQLFRTFNGGQSFDEVTTNFYNGVDTLTLINIDVSPQYPDNVYASMVTHDGIYNLWIYKSYLGNRCTATTSTGIYNESGVKHSPQKSAFMVDPSNDNVLIVAGVSIYRSKDAGYTFDLKMTVKVHGDIRGGDFVEGLVAVATDGGISISTNDGNSWTNKYNGLNVQQHYGHDVNSDFTYLLTGNQDVGGNRYDITTDTWLQTHGSDGGVPYILPSDESRAVANWFCGSFGCNFGICRYKYNGTSHTPGIQLVNSTYVQNAQIQSHSPEARPFYEMANGDLLTAMEDVYLSEQSDTATYWTRVTDFDGTGFKGNKFGDYIIALTGSEVDTNLLVIAFTHEAWQLDEDSNYCAYNDTSCTKKKLLVSHDKGQTWIDKTWGKNPNGTPRKLPIDWTTITDVILNPQNPAEMWVTFGKYLNGRKVFYSPDTGNTWINISSNLPNYPVHSIVYQEYSDGRLFVATDAGVFTKDNSSSTWDCYNENLPPTFCVDLDINNCAGVLTVSTQGRGIYKSPVPQTSPYTVTGVQTWSGNRYINNDLIIDGILTVTGELRMGVGTQIIVNQGAALLLDGGKLVKSSCADTSDFWLGVRLKGDDELNQTYANQPFISMTNGAEISGAEMGISNYYDNQNPNAYNGGIISANNSTFRNNLFDVVLNPYQNFVPNTNPLQLVKDQSQFTNCTFVSDAPFESHLYPLTHVLLSEIDGVEFKGCVFDNQLYQLHSDVWDRSRAIIAGNSSFGVYAQGTTRSEFKNMGQAIYSYTSNPTYTPSISEADFINSWRSIELVGNNYAQVTECDFDIADLDEDDEAVGIYLNTCTQYEIEENTFAHTTSSVADNAVGIVVFNSLDNVDEIFRNDFEDLQVGTLVHGDNLRSDSLGLVMKCNDYDNDGFHIALTPVTTSQGTFQPEIAFKQGGANSVSDPAGNTFGPTCNSSNEQDFYISSNGSSIEYYHHTNAITVPHCTTAVKVSNQPTIYVYTETAACPSNISTGGGGGGGGEPGGGLGLVKRAEEIRHAIGFGDTRHKSDSNSVTQSVLSDYVRLQLLQDTIGIDSIVSVLNTYGSANDQIRMLAVLARRGDSLFGKDLQQRLSPLAEDYLKFNRELKRVEGKYIEAALKNPKSPYHIWAMAAKKAKDGSAIPNPIELPEKRIRFTDETGNQNVLNIFPNPADQLLNLKLDGEGQIQVEIYDVKGSLIKSLTLNGENQSHKIPIQELKNGVHIIKVTGQNEVLGTEQIIIQH